MAKDLYLNSPKNKKDLKKDNMFDYVKEHGTAEDKKWYATLLKDNEIKVKNSLKNGEVVDSYDWKVIREAFAQRFFYDISDKGKAEAKKANKSSTKKSQADELAEWLNS